MKTLVLLSTLFLLASCELYVVDPEPVYIDPRHYVIGTYDMAEYSSTYDEHWEYDLSVSMESSDGRSIVFDNFYNSGLRIHGTVDEGRIFIPVQLVDGYKIYGTGFISGNKLTISYNVWDTYDDFGVKDVCNATGWRI
jgi:hypothetical protein